MQKQRAKKKEKSNKAMKKENRANKEQTGRKKANQSSRNGERIAENKHTEKILQKSGRPGSSNRRKSTKVSYI